MSIALSIGYNLTTGGVFTASAVNNTSVTNVTDFASLPAGGALKLLSTQTASASASISFTSGIDSTYDSYVFKFINIHPSNAGTNFRVNFSTDGGTNYNVTKTTNVFASQHFENDSSASLSYQAGQDLAQSTNPQMFMVLDNANDSGGAGELFLFNPSSTTFAKHFIAKGTGFVVDGGNPKEYDMYVAGYGNTTSAIDAVQFSMATGNIDDGIIKMYGVV